MSTTTTTTTATKVTAAKISPNVPLFLFSLLPTFSNKKNKECYQNALVDYGSVCLFVCLFGDGAYTLFCSPIQLSIFSSLLFSSFLFFKVINTMQKPSKSFKALRYQQLLELARSHPPTILFFLFSSSFSFMIRPNRKTHFDCLQETMIGRKLQENIIVAVDVHRTKGTACW